MVPDAPAPIFTRAYDHAAVGVRFGSGTDIAASEINVCYSPESRHSRTPSQAKFLAAQGLVDANRIVIRGGSAGGYTTLAALVFRDFFQGGASYYGVSDLAALARDTHKFESRYLDWLIGPQSQERYHERSPLYHADLLSEPVIFFQGDEDAVVPPNQAEVLIEALRRKGTSVGYLLFSGEQHGFRKSAIIQRCLDAELRFYVIEVFKISLAF